LTWHVISVFLPSQYEQVCPTSHGHRNEARHPSPSSIAVSTPESFAAGPAYGSGRPHPARSRTAIKAIFPMPALTLEGRRVRSCMDPVLGEKVRFTKFDGGRMVGAEGELIELTEDSVRLSYDGAVVSFRRAPGAKAGWGTGPAKAWRIGDEARRKYCHPDVPRRRS